MEFSSEFLSNQIFEEEILTDDFTPDARYAPNKCAYLQPNGDYIIRIGAPKVKEAVIIPEFGDPSPEGYGPWHDEPVAGVKGEDGVFEFRIPHCPHKSGVRNLDLYLDGTLVIWPFLPICWSGNRPVNFIESPDLDMEFCYIKNVPHGSVINELFWSEDRQRYERCVVYTPPGYMAGSQRYPVLYMMHGGGDNETSWFSTGRANFIFDNLIASGECVPFIAVSVNNMYRYHQGDRFNGVDGCTEDVLLHSCIPHIDSTYRTLSGKWDRAICGLSLGALMGSDCAFRHPEMFGSMGFFTSMLAHETYTNSLGRPWEEVLRHPEDIRSNYKLIFCSATPQEDHMPYFLNDAKLMSEAGLDDMPGYVRMIHDGRFTRWCSWRMGLRDYAKRLFR